MIAGLACQCFQPFSSFHYNDEICYSALLGVHQKLCKFVSLLGLEALLTISSSSFSVG
jgi:hypothetical protein